MTHTTYPAQLTRRAWEALDPAYRLGTPEDGDTRMLRHTTDQGTVLTPVQVVERPYLFPLSRLVLTLAALDALAQTGGAALGARLLRRHAEGDWGDLTSEDLEANDIGLATGGRLLSAYTVDSFQFWVITEADRSATTLLLPSDY